MNAATNQEFYQVYISLGSNISPEENLPKAYAAVQSHLKIIATSTAWESPPFGGSGPNFINSIILVKTNLQINELKNKILRPIETQLGRVRGQDPNLPRPIDLDILIFDDQVVDPNIWVHPFLAVPLAELIPEFRHPQSGETLAEISQKFKCQSSIVPRPEVQERRLIPATG
ncbi:MAG: 2-amino-4-hydroxy-6-hydroxymethyldihydropteridine diphosphokinase [Anaerolineales bacterium]